ncbi:MAG: hypothetical protein IT376_13805 [Polyangiaceae bacterium]|nr:hypothetical protein [Polyangiaceae bacterium]
MNLDKVTAQVDDIFIVAPAGSARLAKLAPVEFLHDTILLLAGYVVATPASSPGSLTLRVLDSSGAPVVPQLPVATLPVGTHRTDLTVPPIFVSDASPPLVLPASFSFEVWVQLPAGGSVGPAPPFSHGLKVALITL